MSNSLFSQQQIEQVALLLQKRYTELVLEDSKNQVFGDPKDFIKFLSEADYPYIAKNIPFFDPTKLTREMNKVILGIETGESQIDIEKLMSHLYQIETESSKKELLSDVTNCTKELLDYCNSILDFSKIELGSLSKLEKKFNVKKLIKDIMTIEMPAAKAKQLDLSVEFKNTIPDILLGDEYRLKRIIINLVSNAIKFTQQGYVKIIVNLAEKSNNHSVILQFIVKDSGVGIPDEKQEFIYEKFTRLSPANKNIYKGIGLGLRIVKQFIEEMEGEIDLKSELGKGSTFICTLPFKLPLINQAIEDIL